MPRCLYSIIASKVLIDERTHLPTAIDIVENIQLEERFRSDEIKVVGLDPKLEMLAVVARIADEEPKHRVGYVEVTTPKGVSVRSGNEVSFDLDKKVIARRIIEIEGLPVDQEGFYRIAVFDKETDAVIFENAIHVTFG